MEAVTDDEIGVLARRYATLVRGLGVKPGEPILVLPNAEFFPDVFRGDQASLELLVARISGYAGLENVDVVARLIDVDDESSAAACGTGACGVDCGPQTQGTRIVRDGAQWVLMVPRPELSNPIVLTARVAAALGSVFLAERHPEGETLAQDIEQAEATAVALGFGVLLLEASYLYQKGCGGPRVASATTLDPGSLSVLLCLFLAREKLTPGAARGELAATQRALLSEAWIAVDESPSLVQGLRSDLNRVIRGQFSLREGSSWLSKIFSRTRKAPTSREDAALAALESGASVEEVAALLGAPVRSTRD